MILLFSLRQPLFAIDAATLIHYYAYLLPSADAAMPLLIRHAMPMPLCHAIAAIAITPASPSLMLRHATLRHAGAITLR